VHHVISPQLVIRDTSAAPRDEPRISADIDDLG
jgi:hypothetical protein